VTVQLSLSEIQVAVAEYLRKRGAVVEDVEQVQLVNYSANQGGYVNIANVTPIVVVVNVKLPEGGPYR
jgi:hypothetical protein